MQICTTFLNARSACFFATNNLKKCIEDIERFEAIWSDKDDRKVREKLADRKSKCLEKMKNDSDVSDSLHIIEIANDYFKLKNSNKSIPCAEEFIGIKRDDVRGRHVVNIGNEPISPGWLQIQSRKLSLT